METTKFNDHESFQTNLPFIVEGFINYLKENHNLPLGEIRDAFTISCPDSHQSKIKKDILELFLSYWKATIATTPKLCHGKKVMDPTGNPIEIQLFKATSRDVDRLNEMLVEQVLSKLPSSLMERVKTYVDTIDEVKYDKYLDTLLTELYDLEESTTPKEKAKFFFKHWMVNVKRKLLELGCENEQMLSLWGNKGVGKDTLGKSLYYSLVGAKPPSKTLDSYFDSHFNAYMLESTGILYATETSDTSKSFKEKLKAMIDGTTITIEKKGVDSFDIPRKFEFFHTTNHDPSHCFEGEDRRNGFIKVLGRKASFIPSRNSPPNFDRDLCLAPFFEKMWKYCPIDYSYNTSDVIALTQCDSEVGENRFATILEYYSNCNYPKDTRITRKDLLWNFHEDIQKQIIKTYVIDDFLNSKFVKRYDGSILYLDHKAIDDWTRNQEHFLNEKKEIVKWTPPHNEIYIDELIAKLEGETPSPPTPPSPPSPPTNKDLDIGSRLVFKSIGDTTPKMVNGQSEEPNMGLNDFRDDIPNEKLIHKNGEISYCNENVKMENFLFEFDDTPLEEQRKMIDKAKSFCKSITYSGGKSYHFIIHTNFDELVKFSNEEKGRYYKRVWKKLADAYFPNLKPDSACSNNARKTRNPNGMRSPEDIDSLPTIQTCEHYNETVRVDVKHFLDEVQAECMVEKECEFIKKQHYNGCPDFNKFKSIQVYLNSRKGYRHKTALGAALAIFSYGGSKSDAEHILRQGPVERGEIKDIIEWAWSHKKR